MALRGNAAIKYTPATGGAQKTHALNVPFREIQPVQAEARFSRWNITRTSRDVVVVGTGGPVEQIWTTIKYDSNPTGAKDMLREGMNDQTLTYFPDQSATGTNYPFKLVGIEGVEDDDAIALQPDPDRWWNGEYRYRILARRTDGGNFNALLTPT